MSGTYTTAHSNARSLTHWVSEARDRIHNLLVPSRIRFHCAMVGTPQDTFLSLKISPLSLLLLLLLLLLLFFSCFLRQLTGKQIGKNKHVQNLSWLLCSDLYSYYKEWQCQKKKKKSCQGKLLLLISPVRCPLFPPLYGFSRFIHIKISAFI